MFSGLLPRTPCFSYTFCTLLEFSYSYSAACERQCWLPITKPQPISLPFVSGYCLFAFHPEPLVLLNSADRMRCAIVHHRRFCLHRPCFFVREIDLVWIFLGGKCREKVNVNYYYCYCFSLYTLSTLSEFSYSDR